MSDNFKYAQLQPFLLAGAGAVIGDTTITLQSMLDIDGSALSMSSDFGTIGYGTLEPGNGTLEEQISFTGLTNNSNGTVTLTGVKNVLFVYPYTEVSGLAKTHAGSATFIISNTSGFYNALTGKADDETITGTWTFTNPNYPRMDTQTPAPTDPQQLATKSYVDGVAVAGASNADTSTKGIVQIATQAQVDAGTIIGSTSAYLVPNPSNLRSRLLSDYVVDTGSPNVIKIAPSPAITSYQTGQIFSLKLANTITSPTVSLNVNGLGAKDVVRNSSTSPVVGDLVAGQMIVVEYDSAKFQVVSQLADVVAPTGTPAQGDILYNNGSAWVRLVAGTSPNVLATGGPGANPSWSYSPKASSNTFISSFSASAGTGAKSVTGVGFRPSFIQFFWANTGSTGEAHWEHTGQGSALSSSSRFGQYRTVSSVGGGDSKTTAANATVSASLVIDFQNVTYSVNTPTINDLFVADFTSFDADGFTLNVTTSASQPSIYYIAYR